MSTCSMPGAPGYSVVDATMNLLLIEPSELDHDFVASIDGARARHLCQVLRAEPGRGVRVGMIDGPLGTGTVLSTAPERARLACVFDDDTPPVPRVDLLLALPRPKVLQRLWAQLAALGVGRIVLTNAARVERNYFDTSVLAPDVYRPLLLEGLQQARDTRVPVVTVHRQFRILVEDDLDRLCPQPTRLLADPGADVSTGDIRADTGVGPYTPSAGAAPCARPGEAGHSVGADPRVRPGEAGHSVGADPCVRPGEAGHSVRAAPGARPGEAVHSVRAGPHTRAGDPPADRVLLAVGPEGGWNDFERRLLEARGFRRVSLGPRTLRTDTACIALLTMAHAEAW